MAGVSILVLVDVALERQRGVVFEPGREFQSLFSWMSLLNTEAQAKAAVRGRVSILVLVDVALELNSLVDKLPGYVGFNPCSRGCRS